MPGAPEPDASMSVPASGFLTALSLGAADKAAIVTTSAVAVAPEGCASDSSS